MLLFTINKMSSLRDHFYDVLNGVLLLSNSLTINKMDFFVVFLFVLKTNRKHEN